MSEYYSVQGPDGLRIYNQRGAVAELLAGFQPIRESDARRIVACLNFMAGTPTPYIETLNIVGDTFDDYAKT